MAKYIIRGGRPLNGTIKVDGSKNATLPILAATILCKDEIILHNVPRFSDVFNMIKILEALKVDVEFIGENTVKINSANAEFRAIKSDLSRHIRSSIFMLGSILSRFKEANLAYPGGCEIGTRPINLHIKGLRELGVDVVEKHGQIKCNAENLHCGTVVLDFPSVGTTENLILASVLTNGITTIINAAKEPEIEDLINFLNSMGSKISGGGTSVIKIEGVKNLTGTEYTVMPDRIIAGTFLIATAITGGRVELVGAKAEHLNSLISKLRQNCCHIVEQDDIIYISSQGRLKANSQIETQVYPGFPTDLQSQMLVLECLSVGSSVITENLFEMRFKTVPELTKMGANIVVKGKSAFVKGVNKLYGADVYATDLRGGVSLVLAGLKAEGYTTVNDIEHIERGYYNLEMKLTSLGADIKKIE